MSPSPQSILYCFHAAEEPRIGYYMPPFFLAPSSTWRLLIDFGALFAYHGPMHSAWLGWCYNIVDCIGTPFLSLLATILLHSLATLYFSGHWHSDSCVLLWMLLSMFLCFQFLWVSIWEWSCWVAFQDWPDSQCLAKQPHWSTLLPVVR